MKKTDKKIKKVDCGCPKSAEAPQQPPANPCVLVIFGMAGDLTKRLLFPAICNLGSSGLLDEDFTVVGVAADNYTTESFRKDMKANVNQFITDPNAKAYGLQLAAKLTYIKGKFDDDKTYTDLNKALKTLQKGGASKNCLFYYASPPQCISMISQGLGKAGLLKEEGDQYFRRIVVEKPFGHDLDSAKALNNELLSLVKEDQIFRIDHFLGKETVQNLLAFRFSNGLFEPIWNHLYIDHIQITVAEQLGVELRGGYYEHAGALRDMVPNHIFQVLSLITMEPPISFESDHIQDEKEKAIQSFQILTPEQILQETVRGQYGPGVINGKKVIGYRSEQRIDPESNIETFAAMRLFVDNWRWYKVPFYIRTGKRMAERTSEIHIQFKSGPSAQFNGQQIPPNSLCMQLQPDEGISLRLNAKVPGPAMHLGQVDMTFKYSDYFGIKPSTGYETILYECMNGDHILFKRAASVESSWAVVQPILDVWSTLKPRDFPNYESGSWGPNAADELLKRDGRKWIK